MTKGFDTPQKQKADESLDPQEQSRSIFLSEAHGLERAKSASAEAVAGPDQSNWRWPMPRAVIDRSLDLNLSQQEKERIGKKVWKNESDGTFNGLTAWNDGEEFPSLGIGHFIWMPKNVDLPFGQSFPEAMNYLKDHGATLPTWLKPDEPCPWDTKKQFMRDFNGKELTELRQFLSDTVPLQTDYLIARLETSLPKILAKETDPAQKLLVQQRFFKVLNSGPAGVFALVDYVNFKGEGLELVPEYHNHSWGLRQVLEGMKDSAEPDETSEMVYFPYIARFYYNTNLCAITFSDEVMMHSSGSQQGRNRCVV